MDITTEAGAIFDNHPRLKNKALLLGIAIVNPCAGSNLGNVARHVGKHLADAVERKKNKYWGSFPATYSLLPLAMPTCGDVGSDVHALIKELAIRRVQHSLETYSNESQHLAEGTEEVARLRRRFSFVLQQASLSFRTRYHCTDRGWRLRAPDRTIRKARHLYNRIVPGGVTGSEGQEGANGVGGGIGVGGGNGDGNGDVNGHGDGDGAGTGTGTGVEVNEGAQDGNGGGGGNGAGTGTGTGVGTRRRTPDRNGDGDGDGTENSSGDGNGDDDNGNGDDDNGNRNEDWIGEGGREAKKRKKP